MPGAVLATPSTPRLILQRHPTNLSKLPIIRLPPKLPRHSPCSRPPLSLRLQQSLGYQTCLPLPSKPKSPHTLVVKMPLRRLKVSSIPARKVWVCKVKSIKPHSPQASLRRAQTPVKLAPILIKNRLNNLQLRLNWAIKMPSAVNVVTANQRLKNQTVINLRRVRRKFHHRTLTAIKTNQTMRQKLPKLVSCQNASRIVAVTAAGSKNVVRHWRTMIVTRL